MLFMRFSANPANIFRSKVKPSEDGLSLVGTSKMSSSS